MHIHIHIHTHTLNYYALDISEVVFRLRFIQGCQEAPALDLSVMLRPKDASKGAAVVADCKVVVVGAAVVAGCMVWSEMRELEMHHKV